VDAGGVGNDLTLVAVIKLGGGSEVEDGNTDFGCGVVGEAKTPSVPRGELNVEDTAGKCVSVWPIVGVTLVRG